VQQDLAPNVSTLMKQFRELEVIGYSRGLLCLYGYHQGGMFVLWNASIRRSIGIVHRNLTDGIFGFATEISCSKPCKSIQFREWSHGRSQVVIEFKALDFPDTITNKSYLPTHLFISKLRESLVLFVPDRLVGVWKMEHDCSFAKLFTFNTPERSITKILGFRKNDELVMETREEQFWFFDYVVEVYQPWSRNIIRFPIYGQRDSFFISSYKETLLLLDHLDSSVYDNDC
ncbi:hypothetical protein Tco_1008087, partial [Tanacetum coccineum]